MLTKIILPVTFALLCGCSLLPAKYSAKSADSASNVSTWEPGRAAVKSAQKSWWSLPSLSKSTSPAPLSLTQLQDQTQAWLDLYEAPLRTALEGSGFTLERRSNVLMVSIPVQGSFNPDRPQMLMPAKLAPLARMAKLTANSAQAPAVFILGHTDSSGKLELNRVLSQQRAQAVAGIFTLSGFKRDRLQLKGVGPDMPRAANDSAAGRALNRRVDVLLAPQDTLVALVQQYSRPTTALTTAANPR